MESNTIATIVYLSDMKPFPIPDLNKKNKYNFCVYGKSSEGKKVDIRKLKKYLVSEN